MKQCSKCNVEKPETEFRKRGERLAGYRGVCKTCVRLGEEGRSRWSNLHAFERDAILHSEIEKGGETLYSFGTPMERASAESLIACGSVRAAAESLQLTPAQLRAHLSELQRKAASRGWSPGHQMNKTVPAGFSVKGVSTYYDEDGAVRGQWVKSNKTADDQYSALLDAMSHIADSWQGLAEPVPMPGKQDEDLLAAYILGDPHLGMHSWSAETGTNFDLKIAEQQLMGAVDHLVNIAPPSKQALVVNLGDLIHADSKLNQTTGGTPVDVDGRWAKVIATAVRVMRRIIDRALEKHEQVFVINAIGNHDSHASVMIGICLAQYYEREPRVFVDTAPTKVHYHRFGQNLIAVTHGDTMKPDKLLGVMVCDRPEDWGATKYRYFLRGHLHHDILQEYPGMTCETFATLAPADAWHKGQGYRSGQSMKVLVFHRQWGQIMRHVVGINQVLAALETK